MLFPHLSALSGSGILKEASLDLSLLSGHQKEILEYLRQTELKDFFYFTGGTALSVCYLHHRYSEDLDFFTADQDAIRIGVSTLNKMGQALPVKLEFRRTFQSFLEIFAAFDDGETVKMDFAFDSPFRFSSPKLMEEIGWLVDDLRDLSANKLSALFDRAESKDFVDIYFLQKEIKPINGIIQDAQEKHVGLETYWLAQAFFRVKDLTFLPRMIKPLTLEELRVFFLAEARRFMDNLYK